MPRVRSGPATQEEYEEWLGRLEEEEPLPDQFNLFQATLRGELYGLNDIQIEKLWETKGVAALYAEHGVKALGERKAWGWLERYAIEDKPGLWSYESLQQVRSEEGW